jgi:hypothetical protein
VRPPPSLFNPPFGPIGFTLADGTTPVKGWHVLLDGSSRDSTPSESRTRAVEIPSKNRQPRAFRGGMRDSYRSRRGALDTTLWKAKGYRDHQSHMDLGDNPSRLPSDLSWPG